MPLRRFVFMLCSLVIALSATAFAADTQSDLPHHLAVPGGVAVIALPNSPNPQIAYYHQSRVLVKRVGHTQYAIVGIPLAAKLGTHKVHLDQPGNQKRFVKFTVTTKKYKEQHIHLDNQRLVTPTAEDLVRINQENALSQQAFRTWTELADVPTLFLPPVNGRLSSPFGLKRFFNGEAKRPHSGLDIAAPEGTPIIAPAGGVVMIRGDFFYNGNTIFIDHGQGLITMYCHMNRIDVSEGQTVKTGQVLGAVGKSGRATGPHLHFSVSLNDARVDPLSFLPTEISKSPDSDAKESNGSASTP